MQFKTTILAALLVTLSWGSVQAAKSQYTLSVNHADGIYAEGETAVFQVRRDEAAIGDSAEYRIWQNRWDTITTQPLDSQLDDQAISFAPPELGWFRCSVRLPDVKRPAAEAGVVFGTDKFQPAHPAPEDFDAFWAAQKERLAASPASPVIEPLTPEQFELEAKNPDHRNKINRIAERFTYANVEIPCLDVEPVRGYYSAPKDAAPGSSPAIILFHAAGVNGGWCRSSLVQTLSYAEKYNAIVIDINAHGMLNGQPQSYYDELAKGELKDYRYLGNQSRDDFYFLGMFLRLMRAIDFLCAQPEWDGQHLIAYGISQGGGQVIAAAGLDERVSAAVAIVPGLCDISGDASGWPGLGKVEAGTPEGDAIVNTMRYFDAVYFSARVKADMLLSVGLIDTTCPPPGIFAAYNQLPSPKRIISVPNQGHHQMSVPTAQLRREYEGFIMEHLKK
ncbi:acetylxylan esterase [Cerasicoccus fimbriatus]|uniref:acetylxylan esterase n=1 Tax=Cerasicoccus fimbriatus TaxID=3014554 RepID=UPI0022B3E371|nr:acetylxylan esterase [Cerasicoccus sp. TK19100]